MNEALANRYQPDYLKMLLAGFVSTSIVAILRIFFIEMTMLSIQGMSLAFLVIATYFFYKVFENMESHANICINHRGLRFFAEVVRVSAALSLASLTQYFFITKPIVSYWYPVPQPNWVLTLLALAIPTFALGRLVFNLRERQGKKNSNQRILLILLSGVGSGLTILMMHLMSDVSAHAVNLLNLTYTVISIYFFYHVFDSTEFWIGIHSKNRSVRFLMEFTKLFAAIFLSSFIQFYWVTRAIYKQNYDPNFVMVVIAFSIPAAAIARIMFELRQAQELALQSRLAQAEAQYNLLETQMQPHFLFNTLNVLSELIYVDPDLACSVTQQLADLYREILTNSKRKFSNLESEISILKKYVQIQQIRFGDRINFKCDINPEYLALSIPSLILQTLVENAIKHGISPKQKGGDIELTVTPVSGALWNPQGPMYEVCVSNSGELYKGPKKVEGGTGLQNTKNRLDLFYGRSHGFNIYSDENKTYVKFRVPQQRELQETL